MTLMLRYAVIRLFRAMGFEITRIQHVKKADPKDFTTVNKPGWIVPCQLEAYFVALNKYMHEGDKVLDVGFGLGYGLNTLAIKASAVSGVDVDQKAFDYCQGTVVGRNPKLVGLKVYDGHHLPFENEQFDVLTCVDVLEHVEDYDTFVQEMLRVTRKGVLISTPNRRPEYTKPDGTPVNPWHLREWNYEELDAILGKHGTVDWNFLNGPFSGPFTVTGQVTNDTLTLTPFVYKTLGKH